MKNYYFIILAILIIFYIIHSVRKNKLSVITSFGWVMASMAMLLLAIFPYSIDWLADFLSVSYGPSLFLTLCVVFLFIIDFNYSKKIEDHQKKIIELEQHIALLESDMKIKEEK